MLSAVRLLRAKYIIRPRKESTMHQIAALTQDPALLADPKSYYDAWVNVLPPFGGDE